MKEPKRVVLKFDRLIAQQRGREYLQTACRWCDVCSTAPWISESNWRAECNCQIRWGLLPNDLLYQDASPFIKFALGENVKQSNWGDMQTTRFPQTRMGVEQVFYDNFIRAREYGQAQFDYRQAMRKVKRRDILEGNFPLAPRRDLELDALNQILNEERFITCHSYRQDEINMLMHVADSMGFRLNTFTHTYLRDIRLLIK